MRSSKSVIEGTCFICGASRGRASDFGLGKSKQEIFRMRDPSCSASSPLAYIFGGVVLFGKELGLIFLVPALALSEASVLFFSIKTSGFVDPFLLKRQND